MNTHIIVYIAGPYRGDVYKNVKKAEWHASRVARSMISFICPHSNGYPHEDIGLPDEYWIEMTLEIMRRYDVVLVTGDYKKSDGTLGEIKEAERLGIRVVYSISELMEWIKQGNA